MTHKARSPVQDRRSRFRPLMLASCLLLGGLPFSTGCRWLSLIGQIDGGTEPDGGGSGGGSGGQAGDPMGTGGAPVATPVTTPHDPITSSSKVDLLFVIDDSVGMSPWQAKLRASLPGFMQLLAQIPGGLPSLHVGVVSTSLGAGIYGNVPGCSPGTIGNLNGALQHPASCSALGPNEHFVKSIGGVNNFTSNIGDVVACLTNIGSNGCGFEHPFEATRLALQRGNNPVDPDNGGFLRPDAFLAIVMLTNEDDCSVPSDSMLFDPNQQTLADPLGGLQSYRCNEFGHWCDQPLPHVATGLPATLTNCRSAEDGKLVTVSEIFFFLKSLKPNPSQIFVAAIAGPSSPYTVQSHLFTLGTGATEVQPQIAHSCTTVAATGIPDYADPAVRVGQFVRAFGPNGVFETICADDFGPMMTRIATALVGTGP